MADEPGSPTKLVPKPTIRHDPESVHIRTVFSDILFFHFNIIFMSNSQVGTFPEDIATDVCRIHSILYSGRILKILWFLF
jgi:hypothetical protein